LNRTSLLFNNARASCAIFNGHLFHVNTIDDYIWLRTFARIVSFAPFFVGAESRSGWNFRWLYDNTPINSSFWSPTQPDHGHSFESFVGIWSASGDRILDDLRSTWPEGFLCQKYETPCLSSLYWNGNTCVERIANGSSCSMNPQCQSGLKCIFGTCS
jgi:hypothetical protein